jgi:hypothetical protein
MSGKAAVLVIFLLLVLGGVGTVMYIGNSEGSGLFCNEGEIKAYDDEGNLECLENGKICHDDEGNAKGALSYNKDGKLVCIKEGEECYDSDENEGNVVDYACVFGDSNSSGNSGSGTGSGNGSGSGTGSGNGTGSGSGTGSGNGTGSGDTGPISTSWFETNDPSKTQVPSGADSVQKKYVTPYMCETNCLLSEDCLGAIYTDTTSTNINDYACRHVTNIRGDTTGYTDHTHYRTVMKTSPFGTQKVYVNPKFTENGAVLEGTPWKGTTGWSTFSSTSANGSIYKSWHPFSYDNKKFAAFTGQDKPHVGITYPFKVILKGFVIVSFKNNNNYIPQKLVIEGSNDGSSWSILKEIISPINGYQLTIINNKDNTFAIIAREKLLSNTVAYSQYRVRVTSDNRKTVYNNISEIRLYTTKGVGEST